MNCPACHAENAAESVTCSACGKPLRPSSASSHTVPPDRPSRRSGSRRRGAADEGEGAGSDTDPAAWRAYRVSLWSLVPGLGLLLGPAAVMLGYRAARNVTTDAASRNRAKAAVLFGALVTLTQWLGLALMVRGWGE
jgi:hypothetical protein